MFFTLSEIFDTIDIGSFLAYGDITVHGLREWSKVNKKDFTKFTDKDLEKIIEYIQDKHYEKR